jgi:adenylate kinase family enzyme
MHGLSATRTSCLECRQRVDKSLSRILVIGTSGSGKTHVAKALAAALDLTFVENDAIIWRANWVEAPRDEVLRDFELATRGDRWVIDGNLAGTHPEDQLVLSRADTIVWLDLPRREVWPAITRRTLMRAWTKQPLFHGNVERWDQVWSRDSMIVWSIKTFARRRRAYTTLFAEHGDKHLVRLRSRREVDAWLAAR